MKQGETLYQLQDEQSPYSSSNTALVTALLTLGAQLDPTQPFQEFRDVGGDGKPRRRVMWLLAEKTQNGTPVKELVDHWKNPAWLAANPESPLAYIKAALDNRSVLMEAIKAAVPLHVVRRGRRMVFIPENASDERREELIRRLES